MRRAWQGVALAFGLGFAALLACGESSSNVTIVPNLTAGTGGGSTIGGAIGVAGTLLGSGGTERRDCPSQPSPRSLPRRQSLVDLDNTLDQVFGTGPTLREALGDSDTVLLREVSARFVRTLNDVAKKRAAAFIPTSALYEVCVDDNDTDSACIQAAIRNWGAQLYRRPLEKIQVDAYVAQFTAVVAAGRSSIEATRNILVSMLLSPYFVMRIEQGEQQVQGAAIHLTQSELAARLSHFAIRSAPDAELRATVAAHQLDDPNELTAQLRRLQQTPAGQAARRLFWREMLGLEHELGRPDIAPNIISEMDAQLDAFIDDAFENQGGTLNSLLTNTKQPFTPALAHFVGLELPKGSSTIQLDPAIYAGLLTTPRFLATHRRPTARGLRIEVGLLCEIAPSPPLMHDDPLAAGVTPRAQLANVEANPACVACHQSFDPAGFALDGFDDLGRQTSFDSSASVLVPGSPSNLLVTGAADLAVAFAQGATTNGCILDQYIGLALDRPFQGPGGASPAPPPPKTGSPPPIPRPVTWPDADWAACIGATSDLQMLQEALVTSPQFATLPDMLPYVIAFDQSPDPLTHANEETKQLSLRYGTDPNDLVDYGTSLLVAAGRLVPPIGTGGAGGAAGTGALGGAGGAEAGAAGASP